MQTLRIGEDDELVSVPTLALLREGHQRDARVSDAAAGGRERRPPDDQP